MLLKNKFNSFIRFEFSPCHVNQHDPIPEFHQPKGRILSSSRGSYPQTSSWWSIYTSVTKRKKKQQLKWKWEHNIGSYNAQIIRYPIILIFCDKKYMRNWWNMIVTLINFDSNYIDLHDTRNMFSPRQGENYTRMWCLHIWYNF